MESINWDAVAAMAEVIGLLLVIASLIYLTKEIRQNTASVDTARYETITTGFNDIDAVIVADPDLAHLFNLAMFEPDKLTEQEQPRLAFVFRMFVNQYHKIYSLYTTGALPEEEWITYAKQAGQFLGSPGGQRYLKGNTDFPELSEAIRPYMADVSVMNFSFSHDKPPNNALNADP